jgi:hypothetical protein
MKRVRLAGFFIIVPFLIFACVKIDKLPSTPSITFTSFETYATVDTLGNPDRVGKLKFHFQDGDGDLGLNPPNGSGQDSVNLFFNMFRVTKGVLVPAADNDPLKPSPYRIPYLSQVGQSHVLTGTISVTFLYLFYSDADTIEYQFYIKDRAGHASDTVSTCPIVIVKDTICKGN